MLREKNEQRKKKKERYIIAEWGISHRKKKNKNSI